MDKTAKFSTKVNKDVLKKLRSYSESSKRNIALIVTEALVEYLDRIEVRPAFRQAAAEVLDEHQELLKELAK